MVTMSTDPFASGPIEPFPEDSLAADHAHEHETHADPVHQEVETHVDPAVAEAVHHVRDRFGARGLRDLITLASYELDVAEAAAASLSPSATDDAATDDDGATDDPQVAGMAPGDAEAR
jgi:hypothetical protein